MAIMKRVLLSLLGAVIALLAAFKIIYRVGLADAASSPHDGQGAMSAFFGAVFLAPTIGLITFVLLFGLTRKSR